METIRVDNREIALKVFYKLFYAKKYQAAAKVAKGIFQGAILIGAADIDAEIEEEFDALGRSLSVSFRGPTIAFRIEQRYSTPIDAKKWAEKCNEM